MGKRIRAYRATDEAVKLADRLSHDEFKTVKHMGKIELAAYLHRVFKRGYDKGREDGIREAQATFNANGVSEHTDKEVPADGDV